MAKKNFFNKITSVINDWKNTSFTFYQKQYVPGLDDSNLTYGNGEEKKGVEINTCVLFVDIRNSVQLTKDKQVRTLGKVYSVFTYCILLAAQNEGGYVRSETISLLIDKVIENAWVNAYLFYKEKSK